MVTPVASPAFISTFAKRLSMMPAYSSTVTWIRFPSTVRWHQVWGVLAAIAAGQNVTEVTADGDYEVLFPANAPSGEYQVFAYTQAKEGFTAAANQYIYSDPFKYFNASDPDRFTLEDVIGVYDSEKMDIMNITSSKWDDGDAPVAITIEESDDEFQGNVMITDIVSKSGKCGFHLIANDQCGPIYAEFNTKTGELLVNPGLLYWKESTQPVAWIGLSRDDMASEMFLESPEPSL